MEHIEKGRKILLCLSVALAYVDWGLLLSLQPAFYPTEAENKGATPSQYGFVFGITSLSAFLFSPLCAQYGSDIGPKLLYISGSFIQALAGLFFGFLEYVEDPGWFIGLSYLLRFLEGAGSAAAATSIMAILMQIFPGRESSITAWTEMSLGLGYMLGPSIGSLLYMQGGFGLPFFVVGGLGVILAFVLLLLVPLVEQSSEDDCDNPDNNNENSGEESEKEVVERPTMKLHHCIKMPFLLVPYFDNFICSNGNGMIEGMLEPHLKKEAGASQMDVAITFLVMGGCYMLTTPIWGYVSDKLMSRPVALSICGNILNAICFVFLGPIPGIPGVSSSVPLIDASVAIMGIGYAIIFVSTFSRAHKLAMANGFKPDIGTSLMVSSLWTASFHLGNFIGPTISGFMVEAWGFRPTTVLFLFLFSAMAFVDFCELCYFLLQDRRRRLNGYQSIEE